MNIKHYFQRLIGLIAVTISIANNTFATTDTWVVNGDGTVTDLATGLIWQQEDDNVIRTHADAINYCLDLSLAGSSDWRLPNIKELVSIVDHRTEKPAIDSAAFPNTGSPVFPLYWSATSVASNSNGAWPVNFFIGDSISRAKTEKERARCVR